MLNSRVMNPSNDMVVYANLLLNILNYIYHCVFLLGFFTVFRCMVLHLINNNKRDINRMIVTRDSIVLYLPHSTDV